MARRRTIVGTTRQDIGALQEQVARLTALVEQQRLAYDERLAAQQAEIAELRDAAAAATGERATERAGGAARREQRTGAAGHRASRVARGRSSTRRALLKWGGAAAAAATVALVASEGQEAHASPAVDGNNLQLGAGGNSNNTASTTTTLSVVSSSNVNPVFEVDSSASTNTSATAIAGISNAANGIGVSGTSTGGGTGVSGVGSTGVSGTSTGGPDVAGVQGTGSTAVGVHGSSDEIIGVWGTSTSGYGVLGASSTSAGVKGTSTSNCGVIASSGSYIDLLANGTGRIYQKPQGSAGAPTSGTYGVGESIRDSNGELFIYLWTEVGGSHVTWARVPSIPTTATGGAPVLFATPYRIYDTRDLTGVPFNNGAGNNPMTPSQIKTLQITGIVDPNDSSIVVPAGATGIIGNLIAITPSGEGFLGIQPSTGNPNSRAWVNYEANVSIDNAVIVGLSTDGKIDIQCNTADAGAALTITGYIA